MAPRRNRRRGFDMAHARTRVRVDAAAAAEGRSRGEKRLTRKTEEQLTHCTPTTRGSSGGRGNIRGNIQIVHYVHCVQIVARSGRWRTIWTYLTPG
jgi:hypothetical protein